MFALRRFGRASVTSGIRRNATVSSVAAEASSTTTPPPPAQVPEQTSEPVSSETSAQASNVSSPKGKGRTGPFKRPAISLEKPRQYFRPIGVGVLPAYDEALKYIKYDSVARKDELASYKEALAKELAKEEKDEDEIERLTEKVHILEIQSEINIPSIRWKANNGMADLNKPVYRHLVEKRWREEGALDLLMERIHQMNVVPDLLPSLHPSLDLRVNYPEAPPKSVYLRTRIKRRYERVEPGVYLLPEQTRKPPRLYTTVFHTDPRLYTLLMVDLDVPDEENRTFQTYLHWMQPNLTLSSSSPSPIPLSTSHTSYIPPHPQRGTPYHRYVILLLPQQNPTERIHIPVPTQAERLGFNYRAFAEKYGLDGSKGGGAHMFREVWDDTVSQIYRNVLKTDEPVYGKLPKPDPYAEIKQVKKYI
ncbi:phosphatidylethanolamine-binding protein [Abortiporus biennis]|nr:phosphatidylethanolamine-binding protein [Abortiporus biennis]